MKIDYYHFDTLSSTNTFVKENLSLFSPHNLSVVTADEQTGGRGRRERTWASAPGNLFMTLAFCNERKDRGSLGMQLALACCELLKEYDPKIKWPNDIVIQGKKVAGILGETVGEWVILGIGVNLNAKVNVENAISLYELKGEVTSVEAFARKLAETFPVRLGLLQHYSAHKTGDTLHMQTAAKVVEGTFLGFDPDGAIRLEVDGKETTLYSGEIL